MTDNYHHDRAMIDFLNDRLGEEEQIARAAIGTAAFARQTGRWTTERVPAMGNPEYYGYYRIVFAVADTGARTQAADLTAAWEGEQRAAHIAYHDPAHVLADIAAKRAVIALHAAPDGRDPSCSSIVYRESAYDCETIRAFVQTYAGHPDYQPEWHNDGPDAL
jgi:hypothetical protein